MLLLKAESSNSTRIGISCADSGLVHRQGLFVDRMSVREAHALSCCSIGDHDLPQVIVLNGNVSATYKEKVVGLLHSDLP